MAFWQEKSLAQMTPSEWESLCDGCGKCCLHKLEDEDSGEVYYTDVACQLLDIETCRCSDYQHRLQKVPACLNLSPASYDAFGWLPSTCAYRLLAQGNSLPSWHYLVSGDPNSIHAVGESVKGRVISEQELNDDDLEERIVHWVD